MIEQTSSWWAEGDFPVRTAERAALLIDGRMTLLEMCHHFLSAKRSIYIAAWGITPELLLVRGKHHRAGPDGSPEQEELLVWLRAKGLEDEDLLFWQRSEELSVTNVLSYAVSKSVDVRVLLWDTYTLPFMRGPKQIQEIFESLGILCLRDDSQKGVLNQPIEAHHQKAVVVDESVAFVGGIDMMIQHNGEYDRWDTKGHHYHSPLRMGKDGKMPHGWHDIHVLFKGEAIVDVQHNFSQRWNAVVRRHAMDPDLLLPEELPPPTTAPRGDVPIQVTRTIPHRLYPFAHERGIATILDFYLRAFSQARHFIYIENQYLWRRTFLGFETPLLGVPHPDMEKLLHALQEALARGVKVMITLPDNPNVGREFTDEGLKYLWEIAPDAVIATGAEDAADRREADLQVYTLATSYLDGQPTVYDETADQEVDTAPPATGKAMLYRPIYVHGKVTIVDDTWITLGSANLNNRGMRDDTEINVAIMHPRMAQGLRVLLMAEHLGLCHEDMLFRIIDVMGRVQLADELDHMSDDIAELWKQLQERLGSPHAGMVLFARQARANMRAVKARQPLVGHILPYIPHDRAQEFDISVHPVHGWVVTPPGK